LTQFQSIFAFLKIFENYVLIILMILVFQKQQNLEKDTYFRAITYLLSLAI